MKLTSTAILILTFVILWTSCSSKLYTRRELENQKVPDELKNRVWKLVEIRNSKILDSNVTDEFNQAKGTIQCSFTFQFGDRGELLMNFKDHKLKGTYLIDGDRFKYLYCGYNMKIVWNTNPECRITPTELAYVFGGPMRFKVDGNTLTITNDTGDSFKLLTTI